MFMCDDEVELEDDKGETSEGSSLLGLRLPKSSSFINLLEKKLSESNKLGSKFDKEMGSKFDKEKPTSKVVNDFGHSEKMKASNFPALSLKIGIWEKFSMNEGDLVAKCYFAKRKLVWEVLGGALKSKIEMQWSDIDGIRATLIDGQPGILDIELRQPPSFYRETNPQPRKHTIWQQASDFTEGQATICRRHRVSFSPGTLDKHYEKLLQCDQRLMLLSQSPFPSQEYPYFDANAYEFSGFSLDFNEYGSQFFPRPGYPYQNFLAYPNHIQNSGQTTRPSLRFMESNSPMPVMLENRMLDDQKRSFWTAPSTHVNLDYHSHNVNSQASSDYAGHLVNSVNYEDFERILKGENGLLSHIESHLLGDTQMECSDDDAIAAKMRSMYPSLEQAETNLGREVIMEEQMMHAVDNSIVHAGQVCYSAAMNWIPHNFDQDVAMLPLTNNSTHPNSFRIK